MVDVIQRCLIEGWLNQCIIVCLLISLLPEVLGPIHFQPTWLVWANRPPHNHHIILFIFQTTLLSIILHIAHLFELILFACYKIRFQTKMILGPVLYSVCTFSWSKVTVSLNLLKLKFWQRWSNLKDFKWQLCYNWFSSIFFLFCMTSNVKSIEV